MNAVHIPVVRARTGWSRLRGLLGRRRLAPGHGLLLDPCRAVHTFGMTRPIDVAFVAADGSVLALHGALGAGRIALCWRARSVLELAAGDAARLGVARGGHLRFVDVAEDR